MYAQQTTDARAVLAWHSAQFARLRAVTSPRRHCPLAIALLLARAQGPVCVELWRPMCRGHVRGQRSRTSCLCLSASSSPSSSRMPSSSRAAGAEFLGLGVHVSGWRSARRCAPAALQLLRQMSRQHFDQRTQPAWHWDPQCEGLSVHLVTNKTCLVEFTVCPLKAGLGVFVSGTTGPRHAPTQINTPPIGGFYAHKKPELGSGRYLLTGHAVRGFFCCCRLGCSSSGRALA
jgi:hypothetical protein